MEFMYLPQMIFMKITNSIALSATHFGVGVHLEIENKFLFSFGDIIKRGKDELHDLGHRQKCE